MTANRNNNRNLASRIRLGLIILAILPGCNTILGQLRPAITTVRLVNNSDFSVRVTVVYADDQNLPRVVLEEIGTHLEFTLEAGEVTSFSRDCDDLQIVAIEKAELLVFADSGPTTESGTLRDGSDFGCRDIITFTFDHSPILTDFAVSTSVQK